MIGRAQKAAWFDTVNSWYISMLKESGYGLSKIGRQAWQVCVGIGVFW